MDRQPPTPQADRLRVRRQSFPDEPRPSLLDVLQRAPLVLELAQHAWNPDYSLPTIKKWLEVFLFRFFQLSQFKRSCVPNGPKVGSGGSLSPRGDWRAPSDAGADVWLRELADGVPDA